MRLTEEQRQERINVLAQCDGNLSQAAKHFGISRQSFTASIERDIAQGVDGHLPNGKDLPPGQYVERRTIQFDKDGNREREWTKVKTQFSQTEFIESIWEAFKDVKPVPKVRKPKRSDSDLLTAYMLADQHMGMMAWAGETGENYDLKIGEKRLLAATEKLVASTPDSETGLILNLGDFYHADNKEGRTERSGNILETDGRWDKTYVVGVNVTETMIQMALQKHAFVEYKAIPGNHDDRSAFTLAVAMYQRFRDNPRVKIHIDSLPFFVKEFGRNMLFSTHGHQLKPLAAAGAAASFFPEVWGRTSHRHGLFGHLHHAAKGGEVNGMTWEIFQSLVSKDFYHFAHGYSAQQSMTAITYHRDGGEETRNKYNVRWGDRS